MQIVIPMSGFGERFRRAGYALPKPLIEIDGKPIIAHIIDMFPGEDNFIFICNRDHLAEPTYRMEEIIRSYCPTARVVGIDAHKLGPVHAVLQIADLIDPLQPVVVNYADFTCYWDWSHFREFVKKSRCDGAISGKQELIEDFQQKGWKQVAEFKNIHYGTTVLIMRRPEADSVPSGKIEKVQE